MGNIELKIDSKNDSKIDSNNWCMQINTLSFTYQPGYYPDISLLIGDVVKGWYGWRNDYQTNIEKGHVVKHGVESGVVFGVEFGVIVGVNFNKEISG
jgi:hypothetical protein